MHTSLMNIIHMLIMRALPTLQSLNIEHRIACWTRNAFLSIKKRCVNWAVRYIIVLYRSRIVNIDQIVSCVIAEYPILRVKVGLEYGGPNNNGPQTVRRQYLLHTLQKHQHFLRIHQHLRNLITPLQLLSLLQQLLDIPLDQVNMVEQVGLLFVCQCLTCTPRKTESRDDCLGHLEDVLPPLEELGLEDVDSGVGFGGFLEGVLDGLELFAQGEELGLELLLLLGHFLQLVAEVVLGLGVVPVDRQDWGQQQKQGKGALHLYFNFIRDPNQDEQILDYQFRYLKKQTDGRHCQKSEQFALLTNNQSGTEYLNMINDQQPQSPSCSSSQPSLLDYPTAQPSPIVRTSLQKYPSDESRVYVGPNTERDHITEEDHESSASNIINRAQSSGSWREFLHEQRNTEGFESEYYQKLLKRKSPKEAIVGKHCSMPNLPGVAWGTGIQSVDIQSRIKKLEEVLMAKFRQEAALTDRQENLDKLIASDKLLSINTVPELRKQQLSSGQLSKKRDKAITHSANPESCTKLPRHRRCTSPLKNRRKEEIIRPADSRQSPICLTVLQAKEGSTKKKQRTRDNRQANKVTPPMHIIFKKTLKKHKNTNRRIQMQSRSYQKKLPRQPSFKLSIRQFISSIQDRVDRVRPYLNNTDLLQIQRELELMMLIEQMHSRVLKSIKCKLLPAERQMGRGGKGVGGGGNVAVSLRNRYG